MLIKEKFLNDFHMLSVIKKHLKIIKNKLGEDISFSS